MWERIQNVPTFLSLTKTTLPRIAKKVEFLGGYCERVRGLKKEYCQIDPTRGEGGPDFSSALAQHNDDNPRY